MANRDAEYEELLTKRDSLDSEDIEPFSPEGTRSPSTSYFILTQSSPDKVLLTGYNGGSEPSSGVRIRIGLLRPPERVNTSRASFSGSQQP